MKRLGGGVEVAADDGTVHGREEDHLVICHHGKGQDGYMEEEHVGNFWTALIGIVIQMRKKKDQFWKLQKKI